MSDIVSIERLARIETRLEGIHETLERIDEHLALQNGRVRALEKWQGYIVGGGAVIVFAVPLILNYFFG